MEEEKKKLSERLNELDEKIKKLIPDENKTKKEGGMINIVASLGALLVLGYFGFMFWGILTGVAIGIVAGGIVYFLMNLRGKFPPLKVRMLGKRKKRMGYVVVMHIASNRAISFEKLRMNENVILDHEGIPHIVTPDDILIWKNKIPIVIQPSWSQRPFSPKDHFEKTIEAKQGTKGWQFLMNYISKTQIEAKKKFATGMIILGIVLAIGAGYYLIKSGAFS